MLLPVYALAIIFAIIAAFTNSIAPLIAGVIMCVIGNVVERIGK